MKQKKYPVTQEHVEKFRGYLAVWQRKLNLDNWRVELVDRRATGNAMAEVEISMPDHLAAVRLGKDWTEPVTDAALESTAAHELMHVLLAPMRLAARGKCDTTERAAEHAVIIVMEKLLTP